MRYFGDLGFGMFGWADDDIGIFGGMRSGGYQKAGQFRCTFTLYDTDFKSRSGEDKVVGKLEIIVRLPDDDEGQNQIIELVNLEIDKSLRGQGYGRRVVDAVMRAADEDILICDIKKTKMPFWRKMGLEDITEKGGKLSGHIRKVYEPIQSASAGRTMGM